MSFGAKVGNLGRDCFSDFCLFVGYFGSRLRLEVLFARVCLDLFVCFVREGCISVVIMASDNHSSSSLWSVRNQRRKFAIQKFNNQMHLLKKHVLNAHDVLMAQNISFEIPDAILSLVSDVCGGPNFCSPRVQSGDGTIENVGIKLTGSFQCKECRQRFETQKVLDLHWNFIHDSNPLVSNVGGGPNFCSPRVRFHDPVVDDFDEAQSSDSQSWLSALTNGLFVFGAPDDLPKIPPFPTCKESGFSQRFVETGNAVADVRKRKVSASRTRTGESIPRTARTGLSMS